jgi:hypothetical protein
VTGSTGPTGSTGATGPTGAGLTEVVTVTSGGEANTHVGEALTIEHAMASGTYTLSDGPGGAVLTGCAVVATINAIGADDTAQATVTGEHEVTVTTYEVNTGLTDAAFSLMVTCP